MICEFVLQRSTFLFYTFVTSAFVVRNNYVHSCEMACNLLVIRAPVEPQVLGSTPCGSEFLRI
jgi:hypothetical protein